MRKLRYIIPFITIVLMLMTTACSYVSDAIEGAITNRASFGITSIEFDSNNETVTIEWDKDQTAEDAFAGFEIYVTEQPNDEYAGYTIRASRYRTYDMDANGTLITNNLGSGSTQTYTDSVSDIISNTGRGKYYYRVGVVHWDEEKPEDRTRDNGYNPPYPNEVTETNYNDNTDISTVSGYAEVVLE